MSAVEHIQTIKATGVYKWREQPSSSSSAGSVPLPLGAAVDGSKSHVKENIDKVISGALDTSSHANEERGSDFEPMGHLGMLEDDTVLHKKGTVSGIPGITTRAVWLEWETHKHLWLPPLPSAEVPENMIGLMYQKKQGSVSGWKQREFRADIVPGMLSYESKETLSQVVLYIASGCIIQRLSGKCDGRAGCIRILWPSGFDLIISTIDEEPSCTRWFQYLCAMLNPPVEYKRRRLALPLDNLTAALHSSAIRSVKSKEQTPYGCSSHTRQLAKLNYRVQVSYCDIFATKQDAVMFASLYDLRSPQQREASHEWVTWATMGKPHYNYEPGNLPDFHYATCPSTTEISAEWEKLISEFPDRHYEELRRFFVSCNLLAAPAALTLRMHIQWRASALPIRPHTILNEMSKGNCFVHGFDHFGCPLIYYFVEKRQPVDVKLADQVKVCVYRLEQALARLPNRDGKVSILVVFPSTDSYYRNTALAMATAKVAVEQYPERLNSLLVYPCKSITVLDLTMAGLGALAQDVLQRIISIPDAATLKCFVPSSCLLSELGGDDIYSFASDAQVTGSPVLMPPLWLGLAQQWQDSPDLVSDYYPPPLRKVSQDEQITDGYEPPESEPVFVCDHCKIRVEGHIGLTNTSGKESECALCRYANRTDEYIGGWKPADMTKYPEPSKESFLMLGRMLDL